ncbi:MAG: oligopeptidase A [Cellvibrionaceae bacterium]
MTNSQLNPLLADTTLPAFNSIQAEHIVPAIESIIADNRAALEQQLNELSGADAVGISWANLVEPLEAREDRLSKAWSPISHLHGVKNSEALREAYGKALTLLTEYGTEMSQHQGLYEAYQQLRGSAEFSTLSQAQQKSIDNALRDFRLGGVALPDAERARFKDIKQRLSELSTTFSNHVLDATQGWYFQTDNEAELAGLPKSALAGAKRAAESRELSGWVITLDIPAYLAVMTHCENRELREKMHRAYVARASELGERLDGDSSEWDNSEIIRETLALRHELAGLLGFANYAERSLAPKMAETTEQVLTFLTELGEKSKSQAEREFSELQAFAKADLELEDLQPWDTAYASEKLRQEKYAISQEELKPYFPADKVIDGMFTVVEKLFGVHFEKDETVETWHEDAQFFNVLRNNENGEAQKIASFYLDIYARENKRGGAWMADCVARRKTDAGLQLPVAFLTCNFTPPVGDAPSLLTHDEVTTLFHEFGHGLHHMLTDIDVAAVSGISGVEWDAVELPSQFLENWCWEPDAIPMISAHHETGEPLPQELLDKMLAAKHFQSAMFMVRQLEFALFDFKLHKEYDPNNPQDPQAVLNEVREKVAVVKPASFNRFQHSFGHIFAGGYAAGYYSYKWAEVLSADAFSRFEDDGIFNTQTGQDFWTCILSKGGSDTAMTLFKNFRGREPSIEPLLRHSGIDVSEVA